MKARIQGNTIILPRGIIRSVNLPQNGECEVKKEKDGIKIKKLASKAENIIAFLKSNRKSISIDEVISISIPEVD